MMQLCQYAKKTYDLSVVIVLLAYFIMMTAVVESVKLTKFNTVSVNLTLMILLCRDRGARERRTLSRNANHR